MFSEFQKQMEYVAALRATTAFARKDSTGAVGAFRHWGAATKADFGGLNPDVIEIANPERFDGTPMKRITRKIAPVFTLDLEETTVENLALGYGGDVAEYTQAATAITSQELGKVAVGAIFDLGKLKIASVQEVQTKVTAPATPIAFDAYDPATGEGHYILHALEGTLEIVALPDDVDAGDVIEASFTPTAIVTGSGLKKFNVGESLRIEGSLLLLGESGEGQKVRLRIWNCMVEMDGSFSHVSADEGKLTVKVTVLSDPDHTTPGEYIELAAATA